MADAHAVLDRASAASNSAQVWATLLYVFLSEKRLDEAASFAKSYVDKNPTSAPAQCMLAEVLWAQGDRKGAKAAFDDALKLAPDFAPASRCALLDLEENLPADAVILLRAATEKSKTDAGKAELAVALQGEGKVQQAADLLKGLSAKAPGPDAPAGHGALVPGGAARRRGRHQGRRRDERPHGRAGIPRVAGGPAGTPAASGGGRGAGADATGGEAQRGLLAQHELLSGRAGTGGPRDEATSGRTAGGLLAGAAAGSSRAARRSGQTVQRHSQRAPAFRHRPRAPGRVPATERQERGGDPLPRRGAQRGAAGDDRRGPTAAGEASRGFRAAGGGHRRLPGRHQPAGLWPPSPTTNSPGCT